MAFRLLYRADGGHPIGTGHLFRASRILQERAATQPDTSSNRWAVTGQSNSGTQRPLGKEEPVVLDGVRRRPETPATAPENSTETR